MVKQVFKRQEELEDHSVTMKTVQLVKEAHVFEGLSLSNIPGKKTFCAGGYPSFLSHRASMYDDIDI